MANGEMREVLLAKGAPALLVRDRGSYKAIGGRCSHYDAPLIRGAMCNGHVRCPWHGACFNFDTGDIEEFPGLDSVPKFQVVVKDGRVRIQGTTDQLKSTVRTKAMKCLAEDGPIEAPIIIIGAGAAGVTAAETLRQEGYTGRLVMLSNEAVPPYDRIKISKAMDLGVDTLRLRPEGFFETYNIELRLSCAAQHVDANARRVRLSDGSTLPFSKLLISCGIPPRQLGVPGEELEGVFYLRDLADANRIAAVSKGRRVIIVGSSFIAMEAAAFFRSKAEADTTMVIRSDYPFGNSFGKEVGKAMMAAHEAKGVRFILRAEVERFESGPDGRLAVAILKSGDRLEVDVALVAVGAKPAAHFLANDSPVERDRFGYVRVNRHMETSVKGIFAAGDIAAFPLLEGCPGSENAPPEVRIGHWHMAQQHGRVVAFNMVKAGSHTIRSVPFFWSMLFGKSVRFCGYNEGYEETVVHGSLEELKFVVFYIKAGLVVAVASLARDPIVAQVAEMMAAGKTIRKEEIAEDPLAFVPRLIEV